MLGSTVITRHPWVIPVVASDAKGMPLNLSNLGNSIGRRGLMAPGDRITGLSPNAKTIISSGTSVAAPFVTGTIALLWSLFPRLMATQIRQAITQTSAVRRNSVVPPLLDAWAAYQYLLALHQQGVTS
jgi:subtilisin family serine protease